MESAELGRIPGVSESSLPAALAESLPDGAPPAPWECRIEAVTWTHMPAVGVKSVLPGPLQGRGAPRLTVGAFVRYVDSPVGEYTEVLGGLVLPEGLLTVHVPFMAVDSPRSVLGGRLNWALPKTLATLSGLPGAGRSLQADGEGWRIRAQVRPWGPALPAMGRLSTVQVSADGATRTFPVVITGRARLARVEIDVVAHASLAGWLRPGRHLAAQWPTARLVVHAPVCLPKDG